MCLRLWQVIVLDVMQEQTLNETTECGRSTNASITEPWTPAPLASDRHIAMAQPSGTMNLAWIFTILTRSPGFLSVHLQSCLNTQWKEFQTSHSDFGISNSSICRVYHEALSSIRNQRRLHILSDSRISGIHTQISSSSSSKSSSSPIS